VRERPSLYVPVGKPDTVHLCNRCGHPATWDGSRRFGLPAIGHAMACGFGCAWWPDGTPHM